MNKVFLKHKGKVSEKEFLEYLDSICKNENIKAMCNTSTCTRNA